MRSARSSPTDVSPVTLAITGASGSAYGLRLLECLLRAQRPVRLLLSDAARVVIATETDLELPSATVDAARLLAARFGADSDLLQLFGKEEWTVPVASGSARCAGMVVCPCSMGMLSAVANGASNNLMERAADVMIKERRPLLLVVRETPLSAIHLENMLKLARLGVTIMPAAPGFYRRPRQVEDLVDFMVARVLDHLDIPHDLIQPWGEGPEGGE